MNLVIGFFGVVLIYILFTLAARALLKRIMKGANKAEAMAYIAAIVPTVALTWAWLGSVAAIVTALLLGCLVVSNHRDQ